MKKYAIIIFTFFISFWICSSPALAYTIGTVPASPQYIDDFNPAIYNVTISDFTQDDCNALTGATCGAGTITINFYNQDTYTVFYTEDFPFTDGMDITTNISNPPDNPLEVTDTLTMSLTAKAYDVKPPRIPPMGSFNVYVISLLAGSATTTPIMLNDISKIYQTSTTTIIDGSTSVTTTTFYSPMLLFVFICILILGIYGVVSIYLNIIKK